MNQPIRRVSLSAACSRLRAAHCRADSGAAGSAAPAKPRLRKYSSVFAATRSWNSSPGFMWSTSCHCQTGGPGPSKSVETLNFIRALSHRFAWIVGQNSHRR